MTKDMLAESKQVLCLCNNSSLMWIFPLRLSVCTHGVDTGQQLAAENRLAQCRIPDRSAMIRKLIPACRP